MITIPKTQVTTADESKCTEPQRPLTPEEQETVIANWGDTENYWHFQKGDESTPEWKKYLAHLNQPAQETPSAAMLAFASATPEEKRAIAAELKKLFTEV